MCSYTCHKNCHEKVFAKCIAREGPVTPTENGASNAALRISHNIPHRFEPSFNLAATWCAHCGYLLPLGKKHSMKCTECGATSHKECCHFLPDHCGLDVQRVKQLLETLEDVERLKRQRESQIRREEAENITAGYSPGTEQMTVASTTSSTAHSFSETPAAIAPKPLPPIYPPGAMTKAKVLEAQHRISQLKPAKAPRGIALDDFDFQAVLGKGNFGKVMLAQERTTGILYAIKILKKEFIIENDEIESTKAEKRVFQTINQTQFPFLVNLHSCFQTESRLYFVMEYVSGGDLMWHIQHRPFTPDQAKFYACEILLALEYFHQNNIIYRYATLHGRDRDDVLVI